MTVTIWTSDDIATLKTAIASGLLSVTYSGPPARTVMYQSIKSMEETLARMVAQVNGRTLYRLGSTTKGV